MTIDNIVNKSIIPAIVTAMLSLSFVGCATNYYQTSNNYGGTHKVVRVDNPRILGSDKKYYVLENNLVVIGDNMQSLYHNLSHPGKSPEAGDIIKTYTSQ